MQPFHFSIDASRQLTARYPAPQEFVRACKGLPREGQVGVLRSFILGGVPCAFEEAPVLYEVVRDYLAEALCVPAENVTLVGSARLGYSTAPPPQYGQPFSDQSDFDFAAVSNGLFQELADAFERWREDVNAGRETVRNAREEKFWVENLKIVPRNIKRGFIDPYKVPNRASYPIALKISQMLYVARAKLRVTAGAPTVRHVSLRVYRDTNALLAQQHLNLRALLDRIP